MPPTASPQATPNNLYDRYRYDIIALIKLSWEAFALNWVAWVQFFVIAVAGMFGLFFGFAAASPTLESVASSGQLIPTTLTPMVALLVLVTILFLAVVAVISTKLMLDGAYERKTNLVKATQQSYRHTLPMLGLSVIFLLAVIAGFILLIIPGVILAVRLQFSFYILIEENTTIIESLKRSWRLSKNEFWMIFITYAIQQAPGSLGNILPPVGSIVSLVLYFPLMHLQAIWYRIVKDERPPLVVKTAQ